jgi:tetratricopeptide (TPR) repeat protein
MNSQSRLALILVFLGLGSPLTVLAKEPPPRIDNLPMYGQPDIQRPERLRKADASFIKKAAGGFSGNRNAACVAWCQEGDAFFNKLDLDRAMRRYNQGWLLDPDSYLPFWGFGRVLLQQDKFQESIIHFENAVRLCDDPVQKPALLSDCGSAYSFWAQYTPGLDGAEKAAIFSKANACFEKSTAMDPNYGNAWKRWSMSLLREQNYAEAWAKLHRAKKAGVTNFPSEFLQALEKAMPEPR